MTRSLLTQCLLSTLLGIAAGLLPSFWILWLSLYMLICTILGKHLPHIGFSLSLLAISFFYGLNYSSHVVQSAEDSAKIIESSEASTIEVSSFPEKKDLGTRFVGMATLAGQPIKVLFTSSTPLSLLPGDRVEGRIRLKVPKSSDDSVFDYKEYLRKDNIYLLGDLWNGKVLHSGQSGFMYSFWVLRKTLQEQIFHQWSGDNGALVAGILLGTKEGLSDHLTQSLQITGLAHIIAISGYNITIIIIAVFAVLKPLPKKIQILMAIVFIICFSLFVGGSAAVVRASIMGIIGLFAMYTERSNTVLNGLLMSGVVMSLWNPYTLVYDIGFQLSFAAVFGLIYAEPIIGRYLHFVPRQFGIYESLACTLSAQVTTLPITLYYFGKLSFVSPLANLLVSPFVPMSMLTSFIALLSSFIPFFTIISDIFTFITTMLLSSCIALIHMCADIPFASKQLDGNFSPWFLIISYLIIFFTLRKLHRGASSSSITPSPTPEKNI